MVNCFILSTNLIFESVGTDLILINYRLKHYRCNCNNNTFIMFATMLMWVLILLTLTLFTHCLLPFIIVSLPELQY